MAGPQAGTVDGHLYKLSSVSVDATRYEILEEYKIKDARVYITSGGKYLVKEPPIPEGGEKLYDQILSKIDMSFNLGTEDYTKEEIARKFDREFWDTAQRLNKLDEARGIFSNVSYYIRRDLIGFDILDVLMSDPDIEDILCSAYGRNIRVNHKRHSGRFHTLETNIIFDTPKDMEKFIQKIYSKTGAEPTESRPISVTYMDDGSRISCTFGKQVSKPGPVIAIRKFPAAPLTITHMLNSNTINTDVAAYLWTLLDAKAVGILIGITGSGKTTLLSSFMTMLNPRWRILTIEDTLELQIPHADWVRYNTRKSYGMMSADYDITIRDLIDSSLTQKPDFEVIGEIRLKEMDSLFQSVGTGHGGLTSFHAASPLGAITRMRGSRISDGEIALTWFVVHSRSVDLPSGDHVRRVENVSEVVADPGTGKISIDQIYKYDIRDDALHRIGTPDRWRRYNEAVHVCGILDPAADFEKRQGLLEECVRTNATKHTEVFEILGRYYARD